jgi:uncharacterized SAM-binding protein YcdF (DUF218 family)
MVVRQGHTGFRNRIVFFILLTGFSAIYISGCRHAGQWLVKMDVPTHADAAVILMGNFPERVLEAADVYSKGLADKIIIVYEGMGPYRQLEERGASVVRTTEQAHDAAVALGVPADSIIMLPGDARSTLDEAVAVRDYLEWNPSVDTLILVSSPAHTRRANMIFRTAFRSTSAEIIIGCSPSRYSDFNPQTWWKRKEDIQSVLSEYLKIISFVLFEHKQLKQQP